MLFSVYSKGKKKFVMLDAKKKRRFTITYKGSKKNFHVIMKDRKRAVLYTTYLGYAFNKPQVRIFSGEDCILTCNCINMFVDREMEFTFMGDVRYRLKADTTAEERKSIYNIIDERDKKLIGKISVIRDENGERSFEGEADDDYYRDYIVMFPICLELCYYKNEI